jgi:hypothetical protein
VLALKSLRAFASGDEPPAARSYNPSNPETIDLLSRCVGDFGGIGGVDREGEVAEKSVRVCVMKATRHGARAHASNKQLAKTQHLF